MVSYADVLQAIKGTDFPAKKKDLMDAAKRKEGRLFSESELAPVLEFLGSLDDDVLVRNPSVLAEKLGAEHKAIDEGLVGPEADGKPMDVERQDRPLAKGGLKPDVEGAEKAAEENGDRREIEREA